MNKILKICPEKMWVPDRTHVYVAYLERHNGPDKAVLVLLLSTEKAKQKKGTGC
jgi:hypothetical protein